MAGDRHRAIAVEMGFVADDLFVAIKDVHVAVASPGSPLLVPPVTVSATTATKPGESVGTPVGAAVGSGVETPAGVIGGGVSPPRMRKIGSPKVCGSASAWEPEAAKRPPSIRALGAGFDKSDTCRFRRPAAPPERRESVPSLVRRSASCLPAATTARTTAAM